MATTSKTRLRIPGGLALIRSTWMAPPARTAVIDIRDRYNEGIADRVPVTGLLVTLGEHELLKFTYLDPQEVADVEAQVAAFNADPDTVWQELLTSLAHERLDASARDLHLRADLASFAARRLNVDTWFTYLSTTSEWAESVIPHDLDIRPAEVAERHGRLVVTLDIGMGDLDDPITLWDRKVAFADRAAVDAEVAEFNRDPRASFRAIVRQALIIGQRQRADEIAILARQQEDAAALIGALA